MKDSPDAVTAALASALEKGIGVHKSKRALCEIANRCGEHGHGTYSICRLARANPDSGLGVKAKKCETTTRIGHQVQLSPPLICFPLYMSRVIFACLRPVTTCTYTLELFFHIIQFLFPCYSQTLFHFFFIYPRMQPGEAAVILLSLSLSLSLALSLSPSLSLSLCVCVCVCACILATMSIDQSDLAGALDMDFDVEIDLDLEREFDLGFDVDLDIALDVQFVHLDIEIDIDLDTD